MDISDLLTDLFERVGEHVHEAVDGIDPALLLVQPEPGTNPIGWLLWHLTRVQDHHVAELLGEEQRWVQAPWPERFGLAADPRDTGYGHDAAAVAAVRPAGPDDVIAYFEDVAARTHGFVGGLTSGDLDRVVDRRWDPPVTLGVRLVSVADDDIQHAAQAVYARGLLERRPARG